MSYYDCPECGREDLGWQMSDVRGTRVIDGCRCKPNCVCTPEDLGEDFDECICAENGCECDASLTVKIVIRRVFDRDCLSCGGVDYRCVYDVLLENKLVRTTETEDDAHRFVDLVFPSAEEPEPDYAWESERGLRIAEGWGC